MKRLFVLIITAVITLTSSYAFPVKQTNYPVKGRVVDTAGSAVGFATVSLHKTDSTLVTGTTALDDGSYNMDAPVGDYILAVRLLGYKDSYTNIKVAQGGLTLSDIVLESDAMMLQGATVTEKVKLVEMKIDKLVMNISQSAFAMGSNALELMKKAPGVTIDKDGNVTLNGQAVEVWIDGRPSYASGKSLEALLRSTDGSSIDKFEIMAHPSAKYDAAGQGGIINIKTKKTILEGLNGNAGIDGGGMYFKNTDRFLYTQSAWANLNYRAKKSRTFVNLYEAATTNDQLEEVSNFLQGDGFTYGTESSSMLQFKSQNYQLKVGQDWFVNDKNTIGAIVTLPFEKELNDTPRELSWAKKYYNDQVYNESETQIGMDSKLLASSANLNYTHVFDPQLAKEITVNADYYFHTSSDKNITDIYSRGIGETAYTLNNRSIITDRDINIYSMKADYQSVIFQKYMFEAGGKWALSMTDNETAHKETTGDNSFNNIFDYREHVAAAYADIAGQLNPKMSFKLGLRAEYTNSRGDWKSSSTVTTDDYLNLFPTAFVGYNTEKARLSLSYTRRINRPSYSQLNPTPVFIDANNYVVGNPELKPQYVDALQGVIGLGQHLQFVLMYAQSNGVIMQNPKFLADGSEAFMWGNFGKIKQPAAVLSITELPLTKWLTWTVNGTFAYVTNIDKTTDYKQANPLGQAYTCFTATLPKNWKIQLDGTMQTSVANAYFKVHSVKYANLSAKKTMLNDRMTLTMSVDDLFRSMTTNLDVVNMPGVIKSYVGQTPYMQKVKIGIDWTFGKAVRTRTRNVGNLEEASRI